MKIKDKLYFASKKTLRFFVHVITAIEAYIGSLIVISPILMLLISVLDLISKTQNILKGMLLYIWLILAVPIFLIFFIKTEIEVFKMKKSRTESK